jgi:cytoskeletal protein CcmA (bactofilin family)
MFNKSKTNSTNLPNENGVAPSAEGDEVQEDVQQAAPPAPTPQRNTMMDMISSSTSKPSILSEGFSFRGEIAAKGAIHVEGSLNGQIQVDDLTIGSRGQVDGVVTCSSLHIKGKFSGTATCNELIVTSSASVDGHVVYQTLSVQKGASIKGELLLVK